MPLLLTSKEFKDKTFSYGIKTHPLTININLANMNQMFDKIQMILMMKTSISNNQPLIAIEQE